MQITEKEEILLEALRKLPASTVDQLTALTQRLASLESEAVDWSESWSEDDLRDYSRASLDALGPDDSTE
ncbi:MAG TPA: hypothetical protein VEU62_18905 [Bryobacterales bacterium]|nr:hypothetical protein [Bryobacterales bacterium]